MVLVLIDFSNGGMGDNLRAKCTHHNISFNNISFFERPKGGDARK